MFFELIKNSPVKIGSGKNSYFSRDSIAAGVKSAPPRFLPLVVTDDLYGKFSLGSFNGGVQVRAAPGIES